MKIITMRCLFHLSLVSILFFVGCDSDTVSELTVEGISTDLKISKAEFDVFVTNKKIKKVQTNALPIYQLGRVRHPFGVTESEIISQLTLSSTDPVFGKYSQETENSSDSDGNNLTIDEKETITSVTLNIPFFSHRETDDDGVGVTDGDRNVYILDSIYGNQDAIFKMKVQKLDYYLRNYDPALDLAEFQKYYSDENFIKHRSDVLFDGTYTIDKNEILTYKEDDPDTETDESTEVDTRERPRLTLNLDKDLFQRMIMDEEGSELLDNNDNFKSYLRGITITMYDLPEDILMLLNIYAANIKIEYSYKSVNDNNLTGDASDDTIEDISSSFHLNFNGGYVINAFNTVYDDSSTSFSTNEDPSNLLFKGGDGFFSELTLFDKTGSLELDKFKSNKVIINEAYLNLKIDQSKIKALNLWEEPKRMYIYNSNDPSTPIIDYITDLTTGILDKNHAKLEMGGRLVKDENGDGLNYKIRITKHITNIIKNDSTNVKLGLVLTHDITNASTLSAELESGEVVKIPVGHIIEPLGTNIFGNTGSVTDDNKLKLEILYTPFNE